MSNQKPADVCLVLRPLPNGAPAAVKIRKLLKALLRVYGLKCVSVSEVPAADRPAAPAERS